eukprot:1613653-Pleurochrysis_carterae.AAC.1
MSKPALATVGSTLPQEVCVRTLKSSGAECPPPRVARIYLERLGFAEGSLHALELHIAKRRRCMAEVVKIRLALLLSAEPQRAADYVDVVGGGLGDREADELLVGHLRRVGESAEVCLAPAPLPLS